MNRFLEQNGVVLDTQTDLIWSKNASLSEFPMTWNEALSFVRELNHSALYGYSDCKLPSRKELFSLMSHETANPSLPVDHPFMNTQEFYWSSTTSMYDTHLAWALYTRDGNVGVGYKPLSEFYLWPVRGTSY